MKKINFGLLLLIISTYLFGQDNSYNCSIFLDGKLLNVNDCYFNVIDSLGFKKKIEFNSGGHEIYLCNKEDYAYLCLLPADTKIETHIKYFKKFKKVKKTQFDFTCLIQAKWLREEYLVIRITFLDKNKEKYYIACSSSSHEDSWLPHEPKIFIDK
ncbi:MAG: hypothetical protein DRN27_09635 [Thermoplasmata archaeon]|nr:MAG: hypothetical protein DRN27_09635 [Thermoplasmata archaeon]